MKIRLKNLREILERNKIFFEILTTLALIFIAYNANKILDYQTNLSKLNHQPYFEIEYKNVNEKNHLIIKNISGNYENLDCGILYTLVFWFPNLNGHGSIYKEFYILNNNVPYFRPTISEDNPNIFPSIDSVFYSVQSEFINYSKVKFGNMGIQLRLRTYLKLGYLDFEGEYQAKYYDISKKLAFQISNRRGEEIFDIESHLFYTLEGMNPMKFEEIISNKNNKNAELK